MEFRRSGNLGEPGVFPQLVTKRPAADSQNPSSPGLVVPGFAHRFANAVPRRQTAVAVSPFPRENFPGRMQIPRFRFEDIGKRMSQILQKLKPFQNVFELTHVSGPRETAKGLQFESGQRTRGKTAPKFRGDALQIVETFPKRKQMDGKNVQSEKEVLAKAARLDRIAQIPMRRADEPEIHGNAPLRPDGHHRTLLQNAEQTRLAFERKLPDFIQKKRSMVRRPYKPELVGNRPRISSAARAFQKAFHKARTYRSAIDRDKRALRTFAHPVQTPGGHLLSRSGFAANQNGNKRPGSDIQQAIDIVHFHPRHAKTFSHPL